MIRFLTLLFLALIFLLSGVSPSRTPPHTEEDRTSDSVETVRQRPQLTEGDRIEEKFLEESVDISELIPLSEAMEALTGINVSLPRSIGEQ